MTRRPRARVLPAGVHVRWLPRVDFLRVRLVNGEVVRDRLFVDFTMGGHDLVYKFIPRGEIWLDTNLSPRDRWATLGHELLERSLMARGLKYPAAHTRAAALERQLRRTAA